MSYADDMRALRALDFRALLAKRDAIEHDPECRNPPGRFHIYTRSARRRLALIAQAIEEKCAEQRAALRTRNEEVMP